MIENITSKPAHDPIPSYQAPPADKKPHPLDSPAGEKLHAKLQDWLNQERERQAINRYQMAIDEDFYDSIQYSDEDALELQERGQAPLVFNKVKPTCDWILGTEKRTRVDFHVYPRTEAGNELADVKTKVLKYVSDVSKTGFHRSRAFKDSVVAGLGWLEDGVRGDPSDDPLYSRYESWRNIWYDSNGLERDGSDWRYIFRQKWVDLDVGIAMFPDRENEIRTAAVAANLIGNDNDEEFYLGTQLSMQIQPGQILSRRTFLSSASEVNNRRERVRLYEAWYRDPVKTKVLHGDVYGGQTYDAKNAKHKAAVLWGACELYDAVLMKVRCAIFTERCLLQDMESPYKHNRFPFTPIWCYRRARDNAPYGVVRPIRDPQEDLNKRASKSLFILSTNKIIMDEGAVEDLDELREEAARPDAIIVKAKGKELTLHNDRELADAHMEMELRDAKMIQDVAGVTDENLGRKTNADSGKAILARQTQGSVVTAEIFDNLRYATQLQGELQLSNVEQFYSEPKVVRLTGARGKVDWVKINQKQDDGTYLNDITAEKADFIVDEQDYRESQRVAMFESMMELLGKFPPEMSINMLDVVMEFSDVPGRDELIARIRKMNGQTDPNAKPTPEQLAEQKGRQEAEQQAQQFKMELAQAELDDKKARANELNAKAEKLRAEISGVGTDDPQKAELMKALDTLQKQTAAEIAKRDEQFKALMDKYQQSTLALKDKGDEIKQRAKTDAEVARIRADAQIEAAALTSKNQAVVDDMMAKFDTLTHQVSEVKQQAAQADQARQKAEEAVKAAEQKRVDDLAAKDAELHKERAAHLDTKGKHAADTAASADKAKAETAKAKPEAAAPAGPNIELHVHNDQGGAVTTTGKMKKDPKTGEWTVESTKTPAKPKKGKE